MSRIGARRLLLLAPLSSATGLFWLSRLPVHGSYVTSLLGASMLTTFGIGLAFTPIAVAATSGVARAEAGLASGLVNTNRQIGGAVGLAALATVAAARARNLLGPDRLAALSRAGIGTGRPPAAVAQALTSGYDRAFLIAGFVALVSSALALIIPSHGRPDTWRCGTARSSAEVSPPRPRDPSPSAWTSPFRRG